MYLKYEKLRTVLYIYMLLPIVLFILAYLETVNRLIYLPFIAGICMYIYKIRGEKKDVEKKGVYVPKHILFLLMVIAVIWCFLGGQGGVYYQSSDWDVRNALYRDILYRDWPVTYPEYNKALVYYISYWIPPASVIKVIGKVFPTIFLSELAFQLGNIALWIWSSIGVFLVELLLINYVKPKKRDYFVLIPVMFILFSGLDIIGVIVKIITEGMQFGPHIEWWTPRLQFSSMTTVLFWVFNQGIVPWLATLCFLQEKTTRNYVFIGLCALASGPIPFLGLFLFMVGKALYLIVNEILHDRNFKKFFGNIVSISNILSIGLYPVYLLYYTSNGALSKGVENSETISILFLNLKKLTITDIKQIFFFVMIEVGIYILLVYKDYKKDVNLYLAIIGILISPFFTIGTSDDFVMRFSIPSITIIAAMTIKCFYRLRIFSRRDSFSGLQKVRYYLLIMCLCLGTITPLTEFFRGYDVMLKTGKIDNTCDILKTINQDRWGTDINFVTYDFEEKTFFELYVRKERRQ